MPHHRFILDDQMPSAQGNSKETILLFLTINARLSSGFCRENIAQWIKVGAKLLSSVASFWLIRVKAAIVSL